MSKVSNYNEVKMTQKEGKIEKVKQAKKLLYEVSMPCIGKEENIDDTALCKRESLQEAEKLLTEFLLVNK